MSRVAEVRIVVDVRRRRAVPTRFPNRHRGARRRALLPPSSATTGSGIARSRTSSCRPAEDREIVYGVDLTDDDRWVVITAFRGASDRSEIHLIDRTRPGSAPVRLFAGFEHAYRFIGDAGGRLFFITDLDAPNGQLVAIGDSPLFGENGDSHLFPEKGAVSYSAEKGAVPITPEGPDKLTDARVAGGMIVACHLHNASDHLSSTISTARRADDRAPGAQIRHGLSGRPADEAVRRLLVGHASARD